MRKDLMVMALSCLSLAGLGGCLSAGSEINREVRCTMNSDCPTGQRCLPDPEGDRCVPVADVAPDGGAAPDGGTPLQALGSCYSPNFCWETPLPSGAEIRAVSATAADDVWAVGAGTLLHHDGRTYQHVSDAVPQLYGVHARARDDVWVVGLDGFVLHHDGARLTRIPPPPMEPTDFVAAYAPAPNLIYALSSGRPVTVPPTIYRYDGAAWTPVYRSTSGGFHSIWGSGPSDIWAGGDKGQTVHFDGKTWTLMPTGVGDQVAVGGAGPGDVYAVSALDRSFRLSAGAWSPLRIANLTNRNLTSVFASGPKDVWVSGRYRFAPESVLYHFDGLAWAPVSAEAFILQGGSAPLAGVAFLGAPEGGLRYDGTTFRRMSTGPQLTVYGLSAIDRDLAYAAGKEGQSDRGVLLSRWGGVWGKEAIPAVGMLRAVAGKGPRFAVAVGDGGVIVQHDGVRWTEVSVAGTTENLESVTVVSETLAFAMAQGPIILRYDGTRWTRAYEGGSRSYPAIIWAAGPESVYVLGRAFTKPALYRFDGVGLVQEDLGTGVEPLHGIGGTAPDDIWGRAGTWSTSMASRGLGWRSHTPRSTRSMRVRATRSTSSGSAIWSATMAPSSPS